MEEMVILVDEHDQKIGEMEKMQAHQEGKLHRAFSVLLFNKEGEMLLQQRALSKYHCAGLWTNACCSHPRIDETLESAVNRRLNEELGVVLKTKKINQFIYKAQLDNGLIEYELDHVFVGVVDSELKINTEEIAAVRFVDVESLKIEIKNNPNQFTPWFKIILNENESLFCL